MAKNIKTFIRENRILLSIMLLAAAARLIALGRIPDGILPDEAYGAYNAYSLMTEGIDSRGYAFPVYFTAWGSGMSVLYSYLSIPFLFLFGTDIAVYRLPQAIVGIISVYAAYVIGKECFDKKFGLLFSFVLAINPWHIMNMRFGLDANLAPGMFLIALCFLILGMKKNSHYFILAAFFFGLTLYGYALSWLVVPIFLLLCLIFYHRYFHLDKYVVLSAALLFVLALPLLLFVAINMDMLPEIKTAFFSIPRLPGSRISELKTSNLSNSLSALMRIIISQSDGVGYTSSETVGAYYFFTTPLIVLGIFFHFAELAYALIYKKSQKPQNHLSHIMLLWLIADIAMITMNENITVIHVNLIHIPVIFYCAYGIYRLSLLSRNKKLIPACLVFWIFSFAVFTYSYFTAPSSYFFDERAEEAINAAEEAAGPGGSVTIVYYTTYKYSNLMWYKKFPADDFSKNVIYTGDPAWAEMVSYGRYRYINDIREAIPGEDAYLFFNSTQEYFIENGFQVTEINDLYSIATSH